MYLKIACQLDAFHRTYKGKIVASSSQIFKNQERCFRLVWMLLGLESGKQTIYKASQAINSGTVKPLSDRIIYKSVVIWDIQEQAK